MHRANAILERQMRDGNMGTIVAALSQLTEREIMDSCEDSESVNRKVNLQRCHEFLQADEEQVSIND